MQYNPEYIDSMTKKDIIDHIVFDGVRILLNHISGRRTGNDRGANAVLASNTTLVEMGMGTRLEEQYRKKYNL
jgi:hypothetical protein